MQRSNVPTATHRDWSASRLPLAPQVLRNLSIISIAIIIRSTAGGGG